ncbi:MAG TPA: tetratricopeptide repeat protein [Gemmatimonadaceae bacterium]
MADRPEYKRTLVDRHGPAALDYVRAWAYGAMVSGITVAAFALRVGFKWWTIPVALCAGAAVSALGWLMAQTAGSAWKHVTVDGSSTPYTEQYSAQQALVMQGRLDEALASFESVINDEPNNVDVRIRAAELYARDAGNHQRAAELFRAVQRIPTIAQGQDVYVSHRLVDLLTGPLNDQGRALVELRRLIERYPGSAAADRARAALAILKARHFADSDRNSPT